jgi:hypothetical protein
MLEAIKTPTYDIALGQPVYQAVGTLWGIGYGRMLAC